MLTTNAASTSPHPSGLHDADERYEAFLGYLHTRFHGLAPEAGSLFLTDAQDRIPREDKIGLALPTLFDVFLQALPAERRQHYDCRACRRFVEQYGSMVMIRPDGEVQSVFWGLLTQVPIFFLPAVTALRKIVNGSLIVGPVVTRATPWGLPSNVGLPKHGDVTWHHMRVVPPARLIHTSTVTSEGKRYGEIAEGRDLLERSVDLFTCDHVQYAIQLLQSGAVPRPERFLPTARWFLDLLDRLAEVRDDRKRDAIYWLASAQAPTGFAHLKNGMLGTMLADIRNGLPQSRIVARFAEKMEGDQYMRPQAAPSAGNIDQAEKLVAKMGIAPALKRRFLRLEEVTSIWTPKPSPVESAPGVGVFASLRPKAEKKVAKEMPTQIITWRKFREKVLPGAERIEFVVPVERGAYFMFITAEDENAPPILQWDMPAKRNPVSWYFRKDGARAADWSLTTGSVVAVRAITVSPPHWFDENAFSNQSKGAWFILDGAKDKEYTAGAGFFPESLKSELHEVRATMGAYADQAVVSDITRANANGVAFMEHTKHAYSFRVFTEDGAFVTTYRIDRWD